MKHWKTVEVDAERLQNLAAGTGFPAPLLRAMLGRGLATPEAIDCFLTPRLSEISDPFRLPQMDIAVKRVWRAIRENESIAVYGDYDADGITGTSLLMRVLTSLGGRAKPYLPNRMEEGYGFGVEALRRCVDGSGPRLVITVDCGTGSVEAVQRAREAGIDVIVTDHHEPSGAIAPALAVINPKRQDDERVRSLAGVGVAFKLCHALLKHGRDAAHAPAAELDLRDMLDLVALGTIADVVPLTGENRILARHGLARLNNTENAGLRALVAAAGIKSRIDAYHVGYILGPRLNAVGRLGDAGKALELLLTDLPGRAASLATELEEANRERKRIENRIAAEARATIDAGFDPERHFGLAVGAEGWHVGVIGVVAARLCARYNRPVAVVAFDEEGAGRGSCRSIAGFNLVRGLEACRELLETFGGHEMAAGMSIRRESFPEFQKRFEAVCAEALKTLELRPIQRIDAWLTMLEEADDRLVEGLDRMRPFGEGNPEPVWAVRGLRVVGRPRVVGETHLKMSLVGGNTARDAIAFGMADRPVPEGPLDVAFTLERNEYMGRERLQLNVKDFRAP